MAKSKKSLKSVNTNKSNASTAEYRFGSELIVIVKPEAGLQATSDGIASIKGADTNPLSKLLKSEKISMQPLFGASEERLKLEADSLSPSSETKIPDLSIYYQIVAPEEKLEDLAILLLRQDIVEAAYVKPPGEPPVLKGDASTMLNDMTPSEIDAPPVTPNFVLRQGYLDAAPGGIDARHAWTLAGGRGNNVNIIDCEWGWRFNHEDLRQNQGGIVAGTGSTADDHGTAVIGEIGGDINAIGITGICPDARVSAVAFSMPSATAIREAANRLRPGDIILLEIHRQGPGASGAGQDGYIAIEWWPDDFDAIRYAISRGIIVVEAAGNGFRNLDNAIYNVRPSGFPASWTNPFNRSNRDSGAIVVGAGAPPPNTHGRNHGPDRSRLDFSNWGALIDAQGWGREVTTCGYGDLQGGTDKDLWYTDTFSGTSSASPIVVGALGCLQGMLRAQGRIPLSPARAREVLRATGSAQQDAPGRPSSQRIGNRPNLRQLSALVLQTNFWVGVQFRGTIPAHQTQRWFTFNWPAHWHIIWTVVPTNPRPGGPQIKWRVQVERASDRFITYWINITNVSASPVDIEARFAVLGW